MGFRILYGVLLLTLAIGAEAQSWTEVGDAGGYPWEPAQVTRGPAGLSAIAGATDVGSGDPRDAYCIKIADTGTFLATTDPATDPLASADFDTRLFLFRADGAPILANDDTPASPSPSSTLTANSTDGSGFVLEKAGEYFLVVAGASDVPRDSGNRDLFDIDSGIDQTHAAFASAGSFDHWSSAGGPDSGTYELVLRGVKPCDSGLDVVFVNGFAASRACPGDGNGSFVACSDLLAGSPDVADVALGFIDDDDFLDMVLARGRFEPLTDHICLGDAAGGFACQDLSAETLPTQAVALGFVDGDQHLDVVLGLEDLPHRICLGDGSGGFMPCSNVDAAFRDTRDVALGYLNGDSHLDIVSSEYQKQDRVCLGDGDGGFTCGNLSDSLTASGQIELGFVDGDGHLDAVIAGFPGMRVYLGDGAGGFLANETFSALVTITDVALGFLNADNKLDLVASTGSGYPDRVCIGDGTGDFECSRLDHSIDDTLSDGIDLAFLNDDQHLDVVIASRFQNQVCLGQGHGSFEACQYINDEMQFTNRVVLGEFAQTQLFLAGFETGDVSEWEGSIP